MFGCHQFILHPLLLALAWWKLYRFPWHWKLWLVFVVHDWGYWGMPDMDGEQGEQHPKLGAEIVRRLLGDRWAQFTLCHSRYYAQRVNLPVSRLCLADKLSIVITPNWLWILLARLSGELDYYMHGPHQRRQMNTQDPDVWLDQVKAEQTCYILFHISDVSDSVHEV